MRRRTVRRSYRLCTMNKNRTRMRPTRQSYIWDILLYSGLGCFSYFFLVRFADIPLRHQDRLLTPQAFVAVMLLFNGVGLGMRYIRLRLRSSYPTFLDNRRRMVLFLVLSALFLFALNYLLLVSVKLLLDIPHPFQLVYKGTRLLLITWLTELVIVSQSVSNRFTGTCLLLTAVRNSWRKAPCRPATWHCKVSSIRIFYSTASIR